MLISPLRYPGGKSRLFPFFAKLIEKNNLLSSNYCEPYAGGAGLALKLLSAGFVRHITLNDIDPSIYAFWDSALNRPGDFCDLLEDTPVSIEEWRKQKAIWEAQDTSNPLTLGFATFYLNRTNRSGIIEGAGPIGGYSQESFWKIDARFVKQKQINMIKSIQFFRKNISLSNLDALVFLEDHLPQDDNFTYLDPPYYVKGHKLYKNFYTHDDHCDILSLLEKHRTKKWLVSYDDVAQIRSIYGRFSPISYGLGYSAGRCSQGKEVIFVSDALTAPEFNGFVSEAA